MEFRRQGQHRALKLPQRSLLIMDDEARLAWQHYIPHRKSDVVNSIIIPRAAHRISFTFRQVSDPVVQPCLWQDLPLDCYNHCDERCRRN